MLTFLRCGVYRLVHGRKFWIGTALASVLCFAVMALMFVTMGMVDVDGTVSTGTVHLTVGGERYAGVEMDADDAALLGMFADRTVPNHSFLLVFMGFFQGGMAGLLVSIIATLAYAEDREHGFVKAELAGRAGRIGYYASQLVLTALLATWYSLVVIASAELAFAVFGIRVADPEPLGQYWRLAGLNILGVVAVTLIVSAMHTLITSRYCGGCFDFLYTRRHCGNGRQFLVYKKPLLIGNGNHRWGGLTSSPGAMVADLVMRPCQ